MNLLVGYFICKIFCSSVRVQVVHPPLESAGKSRRLNSINSDAFCASESEQLLLIISQRLQIRYLLVVEQVPEANQHRDLLLFDLIFRK